MKNLFFKCDSVNKQPTFVGAKFSEFKPGDLILIDNEICEINQISVLNPGKHGGFRHKISGIGILDNKDHLLIYPNWSSTRPQPLQKPIVERNNYKLVTLDFEVNLDKTLTYKIDILSDRDVYIEKIKIDENDTIKNIYASCTRDGKKDVYLTMVEIGNIFKIDNYKFHVF